MDRLGPYDLNQIYCCDCIDGIAQLPDECIDLTVTSPPYDSLRSYLGYTFIFEAVALALWRITKPGGVVVWVVADETKDGSESGTSFRQALEFMEWGFNLETMIYCREAIGAKGSHSYYWQGFEYMFILSKGQPKTFNPIRDKANKYSGCSTRGERLNKDGSKRDATLRIIPKYSQRSNVWVMGGGDREFVDHPAVFPEELPRDHIISWSNPGDIVFDPFMGSGTTAKMAKELGRRFLGFDCSPEYCDIARRRIEAAKVPLFVPTENGKIEPVQLGFEVTE